MTAPETDPAEEAVRAFWDLARFHARLNVAPSYFGPTTLEVVPPPAWSFGDQPEGERMLVEVLSGARTSLEGSVEEYGDELPVPGSLSILTDAGGHPVALLEVTSVDVQGGSVVEHFRVVHQDS
ncbi:hypothetical protein [Nocardioides marinus]|jgi:uncharacterized protein YhfF|uniref:Uncharacterized protein YhfF n=1 Tax=Nocardioides marinus TaxID=374514 RepID=A0A7Y9YDN7_9ACTN|nr:hypothetical protein [Nocardioides marinus]MAO81072.1 hypothetical protein [Nocardioides sp.]MBU2075651.1 hypothetical protein [Actinomycetota bacterium]MBU2111400.1 hypothetical protein [Actinomycetota bacterium]NYI10276.1 uncharacterized protein YhfF [Nocardioides marinus]